MHTEHIKYLLPDFIDDTLDESLRPGVEQHLKDCNLCRSELAELQQTMEMLEAHQVGGPPSGYFSTVLPRVRERLEVAESRSFFPHPLVSRIALPLGVAVMAIFILLSLPFPANDAENAHNPLQAVMHGSTTEELVNVVLDMVSLQPLTSPTVEGETSSLLGARVLRGDHLLAQADELSLAEDPAIDAAMPEGLEQLSESDLDILVQRLGERTMI